MQLPLQDPSNSSSKSVDAASKNTVQSSHPFRVIDNDGLSIHSMQSLGRVGRILSGSVDPSSISLNRESMQSSSSNPQSESPTSNVSQSPSNAPSHQQQTQHQQSNKHQRKQTTTTTTTAEDSHSQNSNYSLTMNHQPTILQEPDVIASTKLAHSKTTDSVS